MTRERLDELKDYFLSNKFTNYYPNMISELIWGVEVLQQENQKLKEQYCERTDCGGRLGNSKKVEELIKENERLKEIVNELDEEELWKINKYNILKAENEILNHYKLLYQKVKERNDKAIEYIEENCVLKHLENMLTDLSISGVKDLLDILNGGTNDNVNRTIDHI